MNQMHSYPVHITHIGGPTALIEIGQLRLLTDPTFDPAGSRYANGPVEVIKKMGPALTVSEIRAVDAVLLSHDQHIDNLDPAGRAFLQQAEQVLTTLAGAQRLGSEARGVTPGRRLSCMARMACNVRVTATPAQHGPRKLEEVPGEEIVRDVTGWIIELERQRRGAIYVSGDTVYFEELHEIPQRYQIGMALLYFDAAHFDVFGPVYLTFTANEGVHFAKALGEAIIIPLHYEGWALIQDRIHNAREQRLAYLLFHCGQSPREVLRCCSREFDDLREVSHLRYTILEHLLRHADQLPFRLTADGMSEHVDDEVGKEVGEGME